MARRNVKSDKDVEPLQRNCSNLNSYKLVTLHGIMLSIVDKTFTEYILLQTKNGTCP